MKGSKVKIAIVGTHSTGKTSIVNYFRDHYKERRLHVIGEVARDMINQGHKLGKGGTQDVYIKYVDEQLKREAEAEHIDYDVLIADRSLVDGLAYPVINDRLGITRVSGDLLNLFERILFFQKSFYDAYIYAPVCFNNVIDGVRDSEEEYRREADAEVRRLLSEYIGSYHQLTCGTVEEMYKQVTSIIEKTIQL